MKPAVASSLLREAATVIAAAEPFDAATLETGLRELIERRGRLGREGPAADPGRDHRLDVSPGHLRVACRARPRTLDSRLERAIGHLGDAVCPETTPTRANGIRTHLPIRVAETAPGPSGHRDRRSGTDTDGHSRRRPQASPSQGRQGKGGQRLAAAFDAVSRMPALEETVDRVVKAAAQESSSLTEIAELGRDRHRDGDRGHAVGQQRRRAARPGRQRPRRRRGADAGRHPRRRRIASDLRAASSPRLRGRAFPSASAATRSRRAMRPRASPASPTSPVATSSPPRRCSTTSASSS